MSTVVAISLDDHQATLVTARTTLEQGISVLDVSTVGINQLSTNGRSPEEEISLQQMNIEELTGHEIDSSVVVIDGSEVLYRTINLPFDDPKKIEQVAKLQVQDAIPFELTDFILDNKVLDKADDDSYEILSTLAPSKKVEQTLKQASELGTDPKIVTTKASALSGLAESLFKDGLTSFGILEYSKGTLSLALFHEDSLIHLREIDLSFASDDIASQNGLIPDQIIAQLRSSLQSVEQHRNISISKLYALTPSTIMQQLSKSIDFEIAPLPLASLVQNHTQKEISIEQLSWAVGLFSALAKDNNSDLIDFRKGKFAYKPTWTNVWSALRNEQVYILMAAGLLVLWWLVNTYTAFGALNSVEKAISDAVKKVEINSPVPRGAEVSFLDDKVSELEDQLRGIGSLSSLSPLDSLKELSVAIDKGLDIQIDALNIGSSRLFFRGSVADNPTLGRLEGALNKRKDRFCEVKVDPKGRVTGSTRVKFTTDIELCE